MGEAALAFGVVNSGAQLSDHLLVRRWPLTVNSMDVSCVAIVETPFDDGFFRPVPSIVNTAKPSERSFIMSESEWASWIGHQSSADDVLDPQQANRMAATLDREPTFQTGDPLPPAWQWLYFHDVVPASQLGDAGHPRLGVTMPPVPLPRRMWAGGRLDFIQPLRLGERVRRVSTIRSITPKQGKTGPLYFMTVEHAFSTDGRRNLLEQQTIVYREMSATVPPARAAAAPTGAQFTTKWSLDNIALFRYSALTFNGHRIHYDADYSRSVEGYPNIVIHGPLIATLLLDLAHRNGRPIARFTYRARSPLFLPSPFTVNGAATPGGTRLWAANDSGALAMDAEVHAEPEN